MMTPPLLVRSDLDASAIEHAPIKFGILIFHLPCPLKNDGSALSGAEVKIPQPPPYSHRRTIVRLTMIFAGPTLWSFPRGVFTNHTDQLLHRLQMRAKEERGSGVAGGQLRPPPPENAPGVYSVVNLMDCRADPVTTPFNNPPLDAAHPADPRRNAMVNVERGDAR